MENILTLTRKEITFNGEIVPTGNLPDIFTEWQPVKVELYGDYFTDAMVDAVRLAMTHKVIVHANSPETIRGMDQVVTGGLQRLNA